MTRTELLAALRQLKVETGSLACLGCGYEHNCGIHGCAILREAEAYIRGLRSSSAPAEERREGDDVGSGTITHAGHGTTWAGAKVIYDSAAEDREICRRARRRGRPCPPLSVGGYIRAGKNIEEAKRELAKQAAQCVEQMMLANDMFFVEEDKVSWRLRIYAEEEGDDA